MQGFVQFPADETEANEKDEIEEVKLSNGVTNINMDDQTEGDKKKPRRRGKKKEIEEKPESKEKKQTNPPSVPIHELFPTSTYLF